MPASVTARLPLARYPGDSARRFPQITGRSINAYRPETGKWYETWLGSDGLLLQQEGRYDGQKMVLEGEAPRQSGGATRNRITWLRLGGGRVRQMWEQSTDSGATWRVSFDGTYSATKVP